MKQRWLLPVLSLIALVLFAHPLSAQTAQTGQTLNDLRLYTELVNLAHERYGAEVSYEDLVESSVGGMLRTLDPHTSFKNPEAYSGMREKQQTSFYGIGISVGMRNGQLTVISPIEGGPASRLGIQAGDVIGTIDGEATEAMAFDEAVRKIKGLKGTQVTITIVRRGLDEPLAMTVTRAEVPQVTVRQTYMMTPDTGYIQLTEFSRGTGREMAEAITTLEAQGMKQLLLDLRNNGGGLLDQAIDVADQFLPASSSIVETRGRTRDSFQSVRTSGKYSDLDVPVVVLVNEGTASASEILAGAIQDHDRGLVVGEPSWGKGLVQTVYNLSYGYGLALTTAKYYTPSGRLIQRDYSSFFDYYAHADAGSPELTGKPADPSQIFETDLGRKVYGGGAITPDVIVKDSELPPFASFLLARNAYQNFAIDYSRRHRQRIQPAGWRPGPELEQELRQWVVAEKIATAEDAEKASDTLRDFSLLQVRAEIMNIVFGQEARHRVLAEGDPQVQAALKLFDRAATMLAQRQALGTPTPRQQGGKGAPGASTRETAAPAFNGEGQPAASYQVQLGLAKLLASEGSVDAALAAFEHAERLAPGAPYVRLEHAQFLARVGSNTRLPAERQADHLRRAAATIDVALRLAPANLDVLRAAGEIYSDFSDAEPAARQKAIAALEAVRGQDPSDLPASISLGQLYLEDQPELSVQLLRDVIGRVPRHPMVFALLAEALLRSKRESEAEAVLVEILAFDPASLNARLTLADLQAERGDHGAALVTLRAAPEGLRDEPQLRRRLAWELYATGDLENALVTVRGLLANGANNEPTAPLRLLEGLVLSAEGRNGEALEILRALHKADPADVNLAVKVAQLLQRGGKSREGAQMLSQLATELARQGKTEGEGTVRLELAQLQLQAKDWDGVERSVAPLLAATDASTRLQAVLLRGDALLEAKRYDEALAALESSGPSPAVEAKRAVVLHRAGRESEARATLNALASRGDAASVLAAAQGWQRLDRYGDSIPILEKATTAFPDSVAAWFLLGAAHERTGQRQQAVAAFRRSLELQPDFHAALNYLGYTYAEAGENLDEALRLARRAVALDPENGAYVDTLGWTYYRLGRHEEARSLLERAIHLDPSDASIHEHLGDVHVALQQPDQARQSYRHALELGADKADEVRRKLAALDRTGHQPQR